LAAVYAERLAGLPGLALLHTDPEDFIVPHIMPVRILNGRKDAVKEALAQEGIPTGVHYKPNHLLSFFGGGAVRLPVTGNEHDEVDRLRGTINQMAEGLEETEKMKNEFISSVSHELRTPLTSIRGWVETLRTLDDPADENYRKGLEIINNETGRLYNMVEELLDFSRLQNGRIRMDCRPLDLVAELTDAVLFCEARIQREGLVLSYTEPEEMIPVYADPDRLRQVFINIMDNAIKYSAPGGRITVKLWAGEYKAFAEIIDQGRGIPPEDLENVKTKFYKGSNSVRGSGIGLALVDSIMTALDGTMDIKSTLGRGTVVTLGLPLYHKA
jgi:signal transduction histidine kinase